MNHGKSSNSSFMTWQSLKSIDATFSVMLCTCAHGKARLNMPTILGTSLKSLLLCMVLEGTFSVAIEAWHPLTGGFCSYQNQSNWTISQSKEVTSSTCSQSGKLDSTTPRASGLLSTEICPATGALMASNATLKAPIPSKSPTLKIWVISSSSGISPLTWLKLAAWP